jgi:hypothetical protein
MENYRPLRPPLDPLELLRELEVPREPPPEDLPGDD